MSILSIIIYIIVCVLFNSGSILYAQPGLSAPTTIQIAYCSGSLPTHLYITQLRIQGETGSIEKAMFPIQRTYQKRSKIQYGTRRLQENEINTISSLLSVIRNDPKYRETYLGYGVLHSGVKPGSIVILNNNRDIEYSVMWRKYPSKHTHTSSSNYVEPETRTYAKIIDYIDSIPVELAANAEMEEHHQRMALEVYQRNPFDVIQGYAVTALNIFGFVPDGALENPSDHIRNRAWESYAYIKGEKVLEEVIVKAQEDQAVKYAVITYLGEYGTPEDSRIIDILKEISDHPYFIYRDLANFALEKLSSRSSKR